MNIVFWALVILAGVFLWAVLSFLFPAIGTLFKTLYNDVVYNIKKDDKDDCKRID